MFYWSLCFVYIIDEITISNEPFFTFRKKPSCTLKQLISSCIKSWVIDTLLGLCQGLMTAQIIIITKHKTEKRAGILLGRVLGQV